ncbi:hypothetical protein ABIB40_001005 [Pedobacter sp. UYP30]|uniref:DUF3667 domain-containing protein n=1 Tax=Pedobacter sp. UYP30 TaxID=1756400 RepID=UPI0033912076
MTNCGNCNSLISENYCPNCGQPAKLKRINGHYIVHEIEHVLHFERGILYTVKELLLRPGENVRHFISKNRSRLVKPIIFIVVSSLIYTVISHLFHIEDGYVKFEETKKSTTGLIFKWVKNHYGYSNIIMGIFITFWAKLFFKKYAYNFYEILILLCFVMGMLMLFFSVFAIVTEFTHVNLMPIAGVVGIAYCTWALGQFFDGERKSSYVKAFASYVLGMLSFMLSALLLGTLVDLI